MLPRIVVIVVNYYSDGPVERLLESLVAHAAAIDDVCRLDVVIADNSMSSAIRTQHRYVRAVFPLQNPGYMGGVQTALRKARANGLLPAEWVVVNNPDIVYPDASLFQSLSSRVGIGPAIVMPQILGANGTANSAPLNTRPSTLRLLALAFIHWFPVTAAAAQYRYRSRPLSKQTDTSTCTTAFGPHGSCFAMSGAFAARHLEEIRFPFLFGEEIVLGDECRWRSVEVVVDAGVRVVHTQHATTDGRLVRRRAMRRLNVKALLFIVKGRMRRHFGRNISWNSR